MSDSDIKKTAIITPFGLYEFLRMPFGLNNAAQSFQRLMDNVCQGLDFVFVYLDDILVASSTEAEHMVHLRQLFDQLKKHGLVINEEKCQFGRSNIEFLGHVISSRGALPQRSKVEAISRFAQPENIKELQRFLGTFNFYRRFIPNAAEILRPMYAGLKGNPKSLRWNEEMLSAFKQAKVALAKATNLSHPSPAAILSLAVDASDYAVGAVLQQKEGLTSWRPLGFFSKHLRDPELKYSTFDRELLAIYLAIKHFRHSLEGRPFVIFTDHEPLVHAFNKKSDSGSARQRRHLAFISEYSTNVQHVKGQDNVVADSMSRPSKINAITHACSQLDFEKLAEDQEADAETQAFKTAITALQFKSFPVPNSSKELLCDVSTKTPRPVLPQAWRRKVFDLIHNVCHPSIRSTKKLISTNYIWHGLSQDVTGWAKSCLSCQQSKIQRHVRAPTSDFRVPSHRFRHVNVDIVGPLPISQGHKYLLTIIDRTTRWPEVIPLSNISADTCAQAFITGWVSRFGIPTDITVDRGTQFTSELWTALSTALGTKVHHTTAYHPQANGMIERFHRTLKASLMTKLSNSNWLSELPWVLLGLRTVPKEDLKASTAELVYGSPIIVPGQFVTEVPPTNENLLSDIRNRVQQLLPQHSSNHSKKQFFVPKDLQSSDFVFIRKDGYKAPLVRPYEGPYRVIERAERVFKIDFGSKSDWITIDRLKPAFIDNEQEFIVKPRPTRGRPRKTPR